MTAVLIAIFVIALVCSAIAGLIYYLPFVPAPFKTWALYAVGAVACLLVILQLLNLLPAGKP